MNKDCLFADKLVDLVEAAEETSAVFNPHRLSLRAVLSKARSSLKKRIERSLKSKLFHSIKEL